MRLCTNTAILFDGLETIGHMPVAVEGEDEVSDEGCQEAFCSLFLFASERDRCRVSVCTLLLMPELLAFGFGCPSLAGWFGNMERAQAAAGGGSCGDRYPARAKRARKLKTPVHRPCNRGPHV